MLGESIAVYDVVYIDGGDDWLYGGDGHDVLLAGPVLTAF
jgi:hypothetical protein